MLGVENVILLWVTSLYLLDLVASWDGGILQEINKSWALLHGLGEGEKFTLYLI